MKFNFTVPFISCRFRYIKHRAFDFLVRLTHCQKFFCFFQILNREYHQQQTLACEHDTLEKAASLSTRALHLEHLCVMSVTVLQISKLIMSQHFASSSFAEQQKKFDQVSGCDWLHFFDYIYE